jgi:hypothetical protein
MSKAQQLGCDESGSVTTKDFLDVFAEEWLSAGCSDAPLICAALNSFFATHLCAPTVLILRTQLNYVTVRQALRACAIDDTRVEPLKHLLGNYLNIDFGKPPVNCSSGSPAKKDYVKKGGIRAPRFTTGKEAISVTLMRENDGVMPEQILPSDLFDHLELPFVLGETHVIYPSSPAHAHTYTCRQTEPHAIAQVSKITSTVVCYTLKKFQVINVDAVYLMAIGQELDDLYGPIPSTKSGKERLWHKVQGWKFINSRRSNAKVSPQPCTLHCNPLKHLPCPN